MGLTIETLDIELYKLILDYLDYGSFLRMTAADPRLYRMRFIALENILRRLEKRDTYVKIHTEIVLNCPYIHIAVRDNLLFRVILDERSIHKILRNIERGKTKKYRHCGDKTIKIIGDPINQVRIYNSGFNVYFKQDDFVKILRAVLNTTKLGLCAMLEKWYVTLANDGSTYLIQEHPCYLLRNEYILT